MHAVYNLFGDQDPIFVDKIPYDILLDDARRENKVLEWRMSLASDNVAHSDGCIECKEML